MQKYLLLNNPPKERSSLTLSVSNLEKARDFKLLTEEVRVAARVYFFKKWIDSNEYDNGAKAYRLHTVETIKFFKDYFQDLMVGKNMTYQYLADCIEVKRSGFNKIYDQLIEPLRTLFTSADFIDRFSKAEQAAAAKAIYDKYCQGTLSTWEMDSLSYYYHDHELKTTQVYNISPVDFYSLPFELKPNGHYTNAKGIEVDTYDVKLITGTVIGSNKNTHITTLLTPYGVVDVKFNAKMFNSYNARIKEIQNGKAKIVENPWFTRGNKLAIFGVRREDSFIPKRPTAIPNLNTPIGLITEVRDNQASLVWSRKKAVNK